MIVGTQAFLVRIFRQHQKGSLSLSRLKLNVAQAIVCFSSFAAVFGPEFLVHQRLTGVCVCLSLNWVRRYFRTFSSMRDPFDFALRLRRPAAVYHP